MRQHILIALLAIVAACSDAPPLNAIPAGSTVLAFGDSVTFGTGASAGEDYPSRLAERSGWKIINAGIPGDTAREARRRLGSLLEQHEPVLVIIELGGNDFLRKRSESAVAKDLQSMIEQVQAFGAVPVLVAVPRLSLLRATAGALKDSDIYEELSDATGTVLVADIFSDVLSDADLRADQIHPNARGYQVFADGIADQLAETGLLNR